MGCTRYFLNEFTNVVGDYSNPIQVGKEMDPIVIKVSGCHCQLELGLSIYALLL